VLGAFGRRVVDTFGSKVLGASLQSAGRFAAMCRRARKQARQHPTS
jgi:hypothetical protein